MSRSKEQCAKRSFNMTPKKHIKSWHVAFFSEFTFILHTNYSSSFWVSWWTTQWHSFYFVLVFFCCCFFNMIAILSKCDPAFVVNSKHAPVTDSKKSVIQSLWTEFELMNLNTFNRSIALVQVYGMYVDGAVHVGLLFHFHSNIYTSCYFSY